MLKTLLLTAFLLTFAGVGHAQTIEPSLLQKPTLSRTQIVFVYAGDLWIVGRDGGTASRLTTGSGVETDPKFSPDGSMIAFTGEYDGNVDVYVVPVTGGVPRRLTYHPGPDLVSDWTPDGKWLAVLESHDKMLRICLVSTIDGSVREIRSTQFDAALPKNAFSPDGKYLAFSLKEA